MFLLASHSAARKASANGYKLFSTAGPDAKAEVQTTIEAGEWVATEHVGRFTHTGPLLSPTGEIPPTGRHVELRFAEIYKVKRRKAHRNASLL